MSASVTITIADRKLRMLAEDTPKKRWRDRETVEAWHTAQGIVPELEGAKEKLLSMLEARGQ